MPVILFDRLGVLDIKHREGAEVYAKYLRDYDQKIFAFLYFETVDLELAQDDDVKCGDYVKDVLENQFCD